MFKAPEGFTLLLNVGMATLILLLGAVMMFTNLYRDVIGGSNRTWLALIFFAYAGFRYMRAWQIHRSAKQLKQRGEWEKKRNRF